MIEAETPRPGDVDNRAKDAPSMAWWRGAVISGVALALALGSILILWLLAQPLTLLLIAIVIAQALSPLVRRLERWLSRGIAVILVYVLLAVTFTGIGALVLPPLVAEGEDLVQRGPVLVEKLRAWLDTIEPESANRISESLQAAVTRFSDILLSLPLSIFSSVLDMILVLFMSLYWLLATPSLHRFATSLVPPARRKTANDVLMAMGQTMGGYVRATAINGVIIGALTYTGLAIIGLDFPLVFGVLAGFGEFLPIIGPILAALPAIAVALLDSPQQAIIVAIFFVALQQLEANLLVPFIMRSQADVPPLLSIFALLVGSTLGGPRGAIIAIPVAGALRVLVVRVLAPAERDWTDAGTPQAGAPARATREPAHRRETMRPGERE